MKKVICFIAAAMFSVSCFALEKNREQALCFGNKYLIQLEENVSIGFAYSDKRLIAEGEARRFSQKWGVGLDVKISNDSRFGFRLGYDDAGKHQRDAVGIVWGKTF